jgi:hypothetical protein
VTRAAARRVHRGVAAACGPRGEQALVPAGRRERRRTTCSLVSAPAACPPAGEHAGSRPAGPALLARAVGHAQRPTCSRSLPSMVFVGSIWLVRARSRAPTQTSRRVTSRVPPAPPCPMVWFWSPPRSRRRRTRVRMVGQAVEEERFLPRCRAVEVPLVAPRLVLAALLACYAAAARCIWRASGPSPSSPQGHRRDRVTQQLPCILSPPGEVRYGGWSPPRPTPLSRGMQPVDWIGLEPPLPPACNDRRCMHAPRRPADHERGRVGGPAASASRLPQAMRDAGAKLFRSPRVMEKIAASSCCRLAARQIGRGGAEEDRRTGQPGAQDQYVRVAPIRVARRCCRACPSD